MKIKIVYIICYCFSFFLFNSCSKEKTFDCIKSTGDIEKEERYFNDFSSIEIDDNLNVILVQSLPGHIVLEAGDNLLPKIKCTQDGNKISIQNKNTCNWVRSYKKEMNVYVGVDQVKRIILKGYGKISNGENLKTDTLGLTCLTYGEVDLAIESKFVGFVADDHVTFRLKGKSNSIAGTCFVNASVDIEEMQTRFLVIANHSMLDSKVYCDSLIQAETANSGNILCKGNPIYVEYKNPKGGSGTLKFP